ncbi:MAG: PKD domain-containing protein, partial [Vicingaceae bacterium]|nr:PKD domain-containing protein [Vicingaceae bacterium]
NIPISYTNNGTPSQDGWNLVGNPYPSSINWDSPGISRTNVNNAIYIWDAANQQYASYVGGIGANGGSRNIPSSQAFWVQANNPGPSLQVTEASKSVTDANFLRATASIAPLRIKTQNTYGSDEIVINFEPAASANFDGAYDAKKIASSNPNLPKSSSLLNGIEYSINQIDPQEINIPIKILTGVTGNHTITIENAYNFNPSSCLVLEDLFTGTSHNLSLVDSFSTLIYDTTQTARFLLHIGAPIDIEKTDISCFNNNDAQIVYTKNSNNPFDITWKDQTNTIISASTNVLVADSITNLAPGMYYIETTDALCGNQIDTIFTTEPNQVIAQFSTDVDTVYLSNGGVVNFTNQSSNATTFNWDFDDLNTSNSVSPSHQYTVAGEYLVTLKAEQSANCFETLSKEIVVMDTPTAISENNSTNKFKAWINNNTLSIKGNQNINIDVRNLLGQVLFNAYGKNQYAFDLSEISSQILILNIQGNSNSAPIKINFIKK